MDRDGSKDQALAGLPAALLPLTFSALCRLSAGEETHIPPESVKKWTKQEYSTSKTSATCLRDGRTQMGQGDTTLVFSQRAAVSSTNSSTGGFYLESVLP